MGQNWFTENNVRSNPDNTILFVWTGFVSNAVQSFGLGTVGLISSVNKQW